MVDSNNPYSILFQSVSSPDNMDANSDLTASNTDDLLCSSSFSVCEDRSECYHWLHESCSYCDGDFQPVWCFTTSQYTRDMRSTRHARDRLRKQAQKYYGWRGVDPNWVGQRYYSLRVAEHNDPADLINTTERTGRRKRKRTNSSLTHGNSDGSSAVPVTANSSNDLPKIHDFDRTTLTVVAVSEAMRSTGKRTNMNLPLALPYNPTWCMKRKKSPSNFYFVLDDRTWTKKDNFEWKTHNIWPLDVRHHHGKRSVREKRHEKFEERRLQRSIKHKGALRQDSQEEESRWKEELLHIEQALEYAWEIGIFDLVCGDSRDSIIEQEGILHDGIVSGSDNENEDENEEAFTDELSRRLLESSAVLVTGMSDGSSSSCNAEMTFVRDDADVDEEEWDLVSHDSWIDIG